MMAARAVRDAMKREPSVDIDAEPLSSVDEDELEDESPAPTPRSKRIRDALEQTDKKIRDAQRRLEESRAADKAKNAGARQARRKKVVDDPTEITIAYGEDQLEGAEELSDEEARMIAWSEEHAAKRKRFSSSRTYYGARAHNIHTSAAKTTGEGFQSVPVMLSPTSSGRDVRPRFQAPSELKSPSTVSKTADFTMPTESRFHKQRNTRSQFKEQEQTFKPPDDVLSPRSATVNGATFKRPRDSTTSSATTTDHAPTVFSHPDSPPLTHSGSVSSLSSVDSIASLLLTQDEKDQLMDDVNQPTKTADPVNPNQLTAQCPLCSQPVSNTLLEEFTIRHSSSSTKSKSPPRPRLTSHLQQKFCREHRAQTAQETWQAQGYPTIDWETLATTRITRHLSAMRSILQNTTPSFYRDRLVDAAHAGKGRRNLLKYLKEGVLDVAKFGYYGPRGAKVAAEAITLRLSRELVEASNTDLVVRDVGVAGFVQAVLVPELLGRWVTEDRGLRLEGDGWRDEVRTVLEESNEMGALVNEDEDRVVAGASGRGRAGGGYVCD